MLEAAARRFYADGLAATGIDTITAEAGVAKMSLYNNFSSKADLVRAYLQARHEEWLGLYRRRLEQARDPREAVLAVFDAYTDHAALAYERGFRGCGLLNAAAELPAGDPGRTVVRPTFSYMGGYRISEAVVVNFATGAAMGTEGIVRVLKTTVKQVPEGIEIYMDIIVKYGVYIPDCGQDAISRIREDIERYTAINVEKAEITVRGLRFE